MKILSSEILKKVSCLSLVAAINPVVVAPGSIQSAHAAAPVDKEFDNSFLINNVEMLNIFKDEVCAGKVTSEAKVYILINEIKMLDEVICCLQSGKFGLVSQVIVDLRGSVLLDEFNERLIGRNDSLLLKTDNFETWLNEKINIIGNFKNVDFIN